MPIEISKEETELYEKKVKRERLILLIIRAVFFVFILGSLFYLMFFYKPNQKAIETIISGQNFLKKEEINQLREIINTVEKSDIQRLKVQ